MAKTQFTAETTYTDAAMLAFVRQAIAEVLNLGQSYALPGGRQWTAAKLPELYDMEQKFQARVDAESGQPAHNYARLVRP